MIQAFDLQTFEKENVCYNLEALINGAILLMVGFDKTNS